MEPKKRPKCFLFTKEEQKVGRIHYNRMLYQLYYEYIRYSGEYDNYRHYMECFYKSRNISNDRFEYPSYESPSSEHSLITLEYTPSEKQNITPLSKHPYISSPEEISLFSTRESDLSISVDMVDVSYVIEEENEIVENVILEHNEPITDTTTDTTTDTITDTTTDTITDEYTPHSPQKKRSRRCFCFHKHFQEDYYDI